ncbi:hypothetical protein PTSG_08229 [Salpingoeca rosetta]|uniref:Transmembrane protein 14C n=1 Tax=Salpingoeca rosetta (strain ATCC 50818 / BSB-021) TaxID=946362 RepID=F2UID3_SALR5|nr:uncharacterized protein PTSG_08229 [Salpingoeca rosetta]EGD76882.1 hypothetical protein PTSG_08229 [Salpingoeca rosetta]|eukprot:XP_004991254.1 hypothetical protein PTSG_08229 [Salpingoeca rosetta]
MMDTATLNTVFGAVVAFGGLMGYLKKKSLPSLIAGGGSGLAYAVTGYLIRSGNESAGINTAILLSLVLAIVMGRRAAKAKKFMPAGLVAAIASAALLVNGKRALEM